MERSRIDMSNVRLLIDRKINKLFGYESDLIHKLFSCAIGIKLFEKTMLSDTNVTTVRSKIGGIPNISNDFIWPVINNLPLTFLGQINLDDVADYSLELQLKGVLYFFVANLETEDYTQLVNNIRVIYVENDNLNHKWSGPEPQQLEEHPIEFYSHFTLPSYQEKVIRDNGFYSASLNELDELEEYISELTFGDEDYTRHHMLGDPNAVQGSVRMFWGASIVRPEDTYYENLLEYMNKAEKVGDGFVLLLQIDLTDNRITLSNYGDNCLYFGIDKRDLKNKNFNKVKLVIQHT